MSKLGTVTYYKKKADTLVSKITRARGKCERCGVTSGVQFQTAHIIGRFNHTLRFDLQNVLCLCANCHRWNHTYPIDFAKWVKKKYPNRVKYLDINKNQITKRNALIYKELCDTLQEKLNAK